MGATFKIDSIQTVDQLTLKKLKQVLLHHPQFKMTPYYSKFKSGSFHLQNKASLCEHHSHLKTDVADIQLQHQESSHVQNIIEKDIDDSYS